MAGGAGHRPRKALVWLRRHINPTALRGHILRPHGVWEQDEKETVPSCDLAVGRGIARPGPFYC